MLGFPTAGGNPHVSLPAVSASLRETPCFRWVRNARNTGFRHNLLRLLPLQIRISRPPPGRWRFQQKPAICSPPDLRAPGTLMVATADSIFSVSTVSPWFSSGRRRPARRLRSRHQPRVVAAAHGDPAAGHCERAGAMAGAGDMPHEKQQTEPLERFGREGLECRALVS